MQELPDAVLGSKDAGDPEGDSAHFLPIADLRSAALHLHEVRKVGSYVF
jgi:hypothetical protein